MMMMMMIIIMIFTAVTRTPLGETSAVQSTEPRHGKPRHRLSGTRRSQSDHERTGKVPRARHKTPLDGRPTGLCHNWFTSQRLGCIVRTCHETTVFMAASLSLYACATAHVVYQACCATTGQLMLPWLTLLATCHSDVNLEWLLIISSYVSRLSYTDDRMKHSSIGK